MNYDILPWKSHWENVVVMQRYPEVLLRKEKRKSYVVPKFQRKCFTLGSAPVEYNRISYGLDVLHVDNRLKLEECGSLVLFYIRYSNLIVGRAMKMKNVGLSYIKVCKTFK